VAFIFDLAFFFTVKSRINSVNGGSATIGNSIWITLVAWLLLFFSGCFYTFGRCCIKRRPRGSEGGWGGNNNNKQGGFFGGRNGAAGGEQYADQMRMEAIRAEQTRKTDQENLKEQGLPAFPELDRSSETKPLATAQYLEEEDDEHPSHLQYRDNNSAANLASGAPARRQASSGQPNAYRGGYAQGAPGTRAVDEYNAVGSRPGNRRQSSSTYSPSVLSNTTGSNPSRSPPPGMPSQQNQFLAVGGQGGHSQYSSTAQYGHAYGGSSYHTAASQHTQYPSQQTNYNDLYAASQPPQPSTYNDPYTSHVQQTSFNPDSYNQTGAMGGFVNPNASPPQHTISPPPTQPSIYSQPSQHQQERSYTLGGGGYGGSTVPNMGTDAYGSAAYGYGAGHSPSPPAAGGYGYTESPSTLPIALTTNLPVAGGTPYSNSPVSTAPSGMHNYAASAYQQPHVAAPQPQHSHSGGYDDSPPVYEAGPGQPAAAWNEKGP